MLDPALSAEICPKGTQGLRGKTHPTKLTQLPGDSVASAPTEASLVTSGLLPVEGSFPHFLLGNQPFPLLLLVGLARQT